MTFCLDENAVMNGAGEADSSIDGGNEIVAGDGPGVWLDMTCEEFIKGRKGVGGGD